MLCYDALKDRPREFLALLPAFARAEAEARPPDRTLRGKARERATGAGPKGALPRPEDRLLFILVYQKTGPLQALHGLSFGLSQPQTNHWIHRLLPPLQQALAELGLRPERQAQAEGGSAGRPRAARRWSSTARSGGGPRTRGRSGRTTAARRRRTPTRTCCWSARPAARWSTWGRPRRAASTTSGQRRGGPGLPARRRAGPGHGVPGLRAGGGADRAAPKKPRGGPLSVSDAWLNRIISGVRVVVEHAIAGVKRRRIVKDVLRLTRAGVSDRVMEVACGLHNLRVCCRRPLPAFDVRDFVRPG